MDKLSVARGSLHVDVFDPGPLATDQQALEEGSAINPVAGADRRAN